MIERASSPPERFETRITFVSTEGAEEVRAEILLRHDEMVLDIPSTEEGGRYLVRGKAVTHFWAGVDEVQDDEPVDVVARWSQLGDVFVGIWIENGVEYLFSFRRPSRRLKKAVSRS